LSNVHKEEAKLLNNKKQASELMSQSMKQSSRRPYQNSTPNLSERIQTYTQEVIFQNKIYRKMTKALKT